MVAACRCSPESLTGRTLPANGRHGLPESGAGRAGESLPALQTVENGLQNARRVSDGRGHGTGGGRLARAFSARFRRVSGDGGESGAAFDGGGRRRYYPPRLKASGAGRYAHNKHSLFHARRGQTGTERREFRRAGAGAVFLMHLLAKWCKEWCKGKNIFPMFTGIFRTAAIKNGVLMVHFRLMGRNRLCVSVHTCGRHRRRT